MAGKKISQLSSSLAPSLTGVTTVVENGTTYKSSLRSLRQTLVDSGSHVFTGSQVINGNLQINGTLIADEYILSSSVTNIIIQNVSGSSVFGNSPDDTHSFTGNMSITGSLVVGTGNFIESDPEVLHVENSGSINIGHFDGNNDNYTQINLQNHSNHYAASGDVVITADNGDEYVHYVDLGINSSNYTAGFVGYENDAYLINAGKDLYIGTIGGLSGHSDNKVHLFTRNHWVNPEMTISGSRQISFNTGSVSSGFTYEFSGSIRAKNELKVDGSVTASYFVGDGSRLTNLPSFSGSTIPTFNYIVGDANNAGTFGITFAGQEMNNELTFNPKDINGLHYSVILENIISYNQIANLKLHKGNDFATLRIIGTNIYKNTTRSLYKGYTAVINQFYLTNDPNINQIIIYKDNGVVDAYNVTNNTDNDDFRVDGLSISDTIVILNMYGSSHEMMSFSVIDPFFRKFVDKVLLNPGDIEATATEAKDNFYNNFNELKSVLPPKILFNDFENVDLNSNFISDGNSDQYDAGNYINTESQTNINYGGGNETFDDCFGSGSSYITVYQDSIFAMMAYNTSVNSVWFTGNIGADGSGYKYTQNLEKINYYGVEFDTLSFSSDFTFNVDDEWSIETDFNGPNLGYIRVTEDGDTITTNWGYSLTIRPDTYGSLYLNGANRSQFTGDTGGDVYINGGDGGYSDVLDGTGGRVIIQGGSGGNGNNDGGDVRIDGGYSNGTGTKGNVIVGDNNSYQLSTKAKLNVYGGNEERNNLILATGNIDSYQGIVVKNFSDGNTASSDIVAIGDTGNEDTGYIDMGVNSSMYTGYTGVTALGKAGDAYLFSSANDLYIGNATPGKELILFNGGFETDLYSKIHIHDQGSVVINGNSYTENNPEALRINGVPGESYNLVTGENNVNNYSQINITNNNNGDAASSDFVVTADNGTETSLYVDMGINNSGYVQNGNGVGHANDGYLYSTANDFLIGNASAGKKLIFFNGGLDSDAHAVMYVHEDKTITINTPNTDPENPVALRLVNINNSASNMHAEANVNDFNEINNINENSGNSASSDIVATNDLGKNDPTQGFIDMGINSTNYNIVGAVGGPGDGYLYSTGNHLHIGNGSTGSTSNLYFFVNGQEDKNIVQTILHTGNVGFNNQNPEYQIDISGTTRIDGDLIITGGSLNIQSTVEQISYISGATSVVDHDFTSGSIFYHDGIVSDFTVNYKNVPTTNGNAIGLTLTLIQGAPAYLPTSLQINGGSVSINWFGGTPPSGHANKIDVVGFSLVRMNSAWTVMGQLTTFG